VEKNLKEKSPCVCIYGCGEQLAKVERLTVPEVIRWLILTHKAAEESLRERERERKGL
jgi:hypothetical protein